ncbi:MAG: hypothetical protein WA172_15615 [Terriglobales bacterium]
MKIQTYLLDRKLDSLAVELIRIVGEIIAISNKAAPFKRLYRKRTLRSKPTETVAPVRFRYSSNVTREQSSSTIECITALTLQKSDLWSHVKAVIEVFVYDI